MVQYGMPLTVFHSHSLDVWRNLAIEEYLLTQLGPADCFLLLWRSRLALVIGRNQNPWREGRWRALEEAGGMLARRISGGGTVYQDEGNLNFSLLLPRDRYDRAACSALILRGLSQLGLPVRLGERQVIYLGERKVSGNAVCLRRGGALHHGTLLLEADLTRLREWLQPALPEITGRGIASVPAPVMNLREAKPDLTLAQLSDSLVSALASAHGPPTHRQTGELDPAELLALRSRHASLDWRFGETPEFSFVLRAPTLPPLRLTIHQGRVKEVVAAEPSVAEAPLVAKVAKLWQGVILRATVLADCLREDESGEARIRACADWLEDQGF